MADSDVSDIASPPSKKARQGDLISLFKNGQKKKTNEVEKENKPNNTESDEITENISEPETQPETPSTPKTRRPSINTPKSGKKRSREEIEAKKAAWNKWKRSNLKMRT